MFRVLTILGLAWLLVSVESTLRQSAIGTPYGSFVWLLLPWLAVVQPASGGLVAAGVYGFLLDCLGSHHPGVMFGLTVISVFTLQRLMPRNGLTSSPRIFAVSFVCCCLMAMVVSMVTAVTNGRAAQPWEVASSIALSAVMAAGLSTAVVGLFRVSMGAHPGEHTDPVLS